MADILDSSKPQGTGAPPPTPQGSASTVTPPEPPPQSVVGGPPEVPPPQTPKDSSLGGAPTPPPPESQGVSPATAELVDSLIRQTAPPPPIPTSNTGPQQTYTGVSDTVPPPKKRSSKAGLIIVLLLLLLSVPVGVYFMSRTSTEMRGRAGSGPYACANEDIPSCRPIEGNSNYFKWLPNKNICGYCDERGWLCGTWEGEPGVTESVCCTSGCNVTDSDYPWHFKDYCLSTNTSQHYDVCYALPDGCGSPTPCNNPTQPPGPTHTPSPSNTPGGPSPTVTPTGTPGSSPTPITPNPTPGTCQIIKIYKDGVIVDPNTLQPGDQVVIAVVGSADATAARIRLYQGGDWNEFTEKNQSGEYVFNWEIPSGQTSFTLEAEVCIGPYDNGACTGEWK